MAFTTPLTTTNIADGAQVAEAGTANTFDQMGPGGTARQAMAGPPAAEATTTTASR